jgi:hypothetical protein
MDLKKYKIKSSIDAKIGAMIPPGGGRQPISNQLQSKFILITVPTPAETQLKRIYSLLLSNHLAKFRE